MTRVRAADLGLLAAAVLLSLSLVPSRGTEDVELWRYWTDKVLELGLREGYASAPDSYPPGSAGALLLLAHVARLVGLGRFLVLKLSLWLGLLGLTAIAWYWTRSLRWAAAVHLGLLLNSAALGYLDVYFGVPFLLALLALRSGRHLPAGLCYGLACSFKWQPLIAGPSLLLYLALGGTERHPAATLRRTLLFGAGALAPLAAAFAVVGFDLTASVAHAMSHGYLSGNALNLPWLAQAALHVIDPGSFGPLARGEAVLSREAWLISTLEPWIVLPFRLVFLSAFGLALLAFLRSRRSFEDFLASALLGSLAYFALNTGVHENHLFLSLVLAAALAFESGPSRRWFVQWTCAANLNLLLFYGLTGRPFALANRWGDELSLALAAWNVLLFGWTLSQARRRMSASTRGSSRL